MFWENGIDADLISMEDPLDGYLFISAPINYMYREGYADKVRQYVQEGGHYLTICVLSAIILWRTFLGSPRKKLMRRGKVLRTVFSMKALNMPPAPSVTYAIPPIQ